MAQTPRIFRPAHACASSADVGRRDARRSSSARGYADGWPALRKWFIAHNPLCKHCLAEGRTQAAFDVDHIVPVEEAPERRLDPTNLQSLCRRHHRLKTIADKKKTRSSERKCEGGTGRGGEGATENRKP